MRRISHSFGLSLTAAALVMVAGCRPPKVFPHEDFAGEPIRAASREEIARALHDDAVAVAGLKGKLTLGVQESGRDGFRTCSGALAARNPWAAGGGAGLYVKGYRNLVPTLFTLVSDGSRFWLHVPRDNVVYTGPVAQGRGAGAGREVPVAARDLFRALFVHPFSADDEMAVEEEPAAYVVSLRRDGVLQRRLWVERRRFTIRREVFYGAAGEEELAIDRDRYADAGGHLYPGRMVLRDLVGGGAVLLEFERVTLNPGDLGADAFRPHLPAGARREPVAGGEDGS